MLVKRSKLITPYGHNEHELTSEVAAGDSLGCIYKAESPLLHRTVALKFLPDNVAETIRTADEIIYPYAGEHGNWVKTERHIDRRKSAWSLVPWV